MKMGCFDNGVICIIKKFSPSF